jgi:tRNA-splicing ligase RtcB (3'-phosphate/5'-hydroxy nucleic acid ligase)
MYTVIEESDQRVPIKTWLPPGEIEPGALEQLKNAAKHPDVGPHVSVMPDCHVGQGVTIGCVLPSPTAMLPTAVGVDIGCGMCAVPTGTKFHAKKMDARFWQKWGNSLNRAVPTGFATHSQPQNWDGLDVRLRATPLQQLVRGKGAVQLGTLGGGNHFLEAQVDEIGEIWFMVHSGSRHTGLRIAGHYTDLAKDITAARGIQVPPALWSLPLDDQIAQDYAHDMEWATNFALESRYRMLESMLEAFGMGVEDVGGREAIINIHHNFARIEDHNGEKLVVHRKGATSALPGEMGIIPGSMGAPSYIVRGLGNEESFASCSHGAGRKMSRTQAKNTIAEADLKSALKGTFTVASKGVLDEAPQAYKDVTKVIARQTGLIEVVHTLRPIMTLKGDSKARDD